jgi:hypothetical protein
MVVFGNTVQYFLIIVFKVVRSECIYMGTCASKKEYYGGQNQHQA